MIDINKAKNVFNKYTENYNMSNEHIERKYYHSYRVMSLSKSIAESLNLSQEQIKIATIIGLLHDIARFEQYTQYQTFNDLVSFDHGDYAIKILEENSFLREFIKE
jgi:putative nucleotidyltransferase with HDIG domain